VPVLVLTVGAVGAAAPVLVYAAEDALTVVADVFVFLVGAVGAAAAVGGGTAKFAL